MNLDRFDLAEFDGEGGGGVSEYVGCATWRGHIKNAGRESAFSMRKTIYTIDTRSPRTV
jgi:hypothetical protein